MLRSLQACRAIAALMVLLYHLGPTVAHYFGQPAILVPWGRAGVDFFFVLSGFIIAMAHWDDIGKPERLGRFAWKRFVRIYPIYWVVFLLALAGGYRYLSLSPTQVTQALLLTPTGIAPVISVAWSLQAEVVFYLLFAALIVHPLLALVATAGMLAWLPLNHAYLLMFGAGVVCAFVDRRKMAVPGRLLAGLGLLVFTTACGVETVSGTHPLFGYGLGAALIVLGLVRAERNGKVFGNHPLMQTLGNASYCIYLVHYPFISAACKAAAALGLQGARWGSVTYVATLAGALLVGVLLHLFVERPLMAKLNSRAGHSRLQPSPGRS